MKNNFKKFKKGPFITAIIFVTVAIAGFVWLDKEIEKNNQITRDREAEIAAETQKKEETKSFERILKSVENERSMLDTHFIKSSDVAVFLDMIENLAEPVNATAEVTQVDVAPDNKSLTVGLRAEGSFEALYKFIKLIENSRYQLEVASMSMQRIGTVSEAPTIPGGEPVVSAVKWSAIYKIKLLSYIQ